jgi:GAF domain-containing protein
VIAIENVRLFNETKESLARQTAISEILRVISSSPTDVQPVLDTIAISAARYCGADDAGVVVIGEDGGAVTLTATHGSTPQPARAFNLQARSVTALSIQQVRLFNIADMEALSDEEFADGKQYAREYGYRAFLSAPLLKDGGAIGAIQLRRNAPGEFTTQQVDLVQTFAAQAVIALDNVRLFNETKEALAQQTATSEVLGVISRSTTDTAPVFQSIAERTGKLLDSTRAFVWLVEQGRIELAAWWGDVPAEWLDYMEKRGPMAVDRTSGPGRAVLERSTVHIPDVLADPEWTQHAGQQIAGGYRTLLATPLLRDGEPIGAISVASTEIRTTNGRSSSSRRSRIRP